MKTQCATEWWMLDGDDPCDEVYFVKGHVRIGYSYKSYHGNKAISAKDCCMKCKEDPESSKSIVSVLGWVFCFCDRMCGLVIWLKS